MLSQGLYKARTGRLHVMQRMLEGVCVIGVARCTLSSTLTLIHNVNALLVSAVLPESRAAVKPHAPQVSSITIPLLLRGKVIGTGGATIKRITALTGADISVGYPAVPVVIPLFSMCERLPSLCCRTLAFGVSSSCLTHQRTCWCMHRRSKLGNKPSP
jgi:hypothetical protein